MKKISFFIAVVAVMMCFSVAAFASNEAPYTFATNNIDVVVGEGTETVDVTLNITFDEAVTISASNITFDTDGLSVVSINSDALDALIPRDAGGSDVANGMITNIDMTNFATADVAAGTTISVVATLEVDKTVEKVYTITLTGDTNILGDDFETPINDGTTYPTATITVKAAAPVVEYETVDVIGDAIAADTTSVTTYENYAVYANAFTAPADVESVNALGFKVEGKDDVEFDAAITGTVKYIVAYVGADADTAVVKPFYNVTRVKQ